MSRSSTVAIVSDIHYAGENERSRGDEILQGVDSKLTLFLLKTYRNYFWLRHPFAHNHLLDQFLLGAGGADYAIANGDYCCNVAYHGVADDGTYQSAAECLHKLRQGFGQRLWATYGDHELGKKKLGGEAGGLSLNSWYRAGRELGLEPFWEFNIGSYVLMGVASTLIALPIYETEAAPVERPEWQSLRATHVAQIDRAFRRLRSDQKVLLFCHDPTALPYLQQIGGVMEKLGQIERTIIGHLHSPLLLRQSQLLSGVPALNFGHTSRRISSALRQVRHWRPFKILLCPAPFGIELRRDGGYYSVELDHAARMPARFTFHPLPW